MRTSRLLVIAPNKDLRDSLVFALEAEGHAVTALEAIPGTAWLAAQDFECTVLDQKALTGQPSESISFCARAFPVVLLAARPHEWLIEWVAQVVEMPVAGNAVATAVREAINIPQADPRHWAQTTENSRG